MEHVDAWRDGGLGSVNGFLAGVDYEAGCSLGAGQAGRRMFIGFPHVIDFSAGLEPHWITRNSNNHSAKKGL